VDPFKLAKFHQISNIACAAPAWSYHGCTVKNLPLQNRKFPTKGKERNPLFSESETEKYNNEIS